MTHYAALSNPRSPASNSAQLDALSFKHRHFRPTIRPGFSPHGPPHFQVYSANNMMHSPEAIRAAKLRHKQIMSTFQAEAEKLQIQNPRWSFARAYEAALSAKSGLYEELVDLGPLVNAPKRRW